jgi:Uma2 family endonuclease
MTVAEYFQTPVQRVPQELVFGTMRVAESPSVSHQRVVRELVLALAPAVYERALGELLFAPMDVVLDYDAALVVQPDVLFVGRERAHIVDDKVYGPPDMVVEVLSPSPRIGKLAERIDWFARYGVRECWLARLSQRTVTVLSLTPEGVASEVVYTGAERVRSAVLDVDLSPERLYGW